MPRDFNALMRQHNVDRIEGELTSFAGALRESIVDALAHSSDPSEVEAEMRRNLDQFATAFDKAIPRWQQGETLFAKIDTRPIQHLIDSSERLAKFFGAETVDPGKTTVVKERPVTVTRTDVAKNVHGKARELAKTRNISEVEARAEVWEKNPELGKAYNALPVESEQPQTGREPVTKADSVLREHSQKAAELRKSRPELSSAQARAEVWKQNPDLSRRYREAVDG